MKTNVKITDIDTEVFSKFDYSFNGESEFKEHDMPRIDEDFNLGVIVGSSGSGKSTLLDKFGVEQEIAWDNSKSIISHFENPDDAITKLTAVGLNSIPTWGKPRSVLSTGEGFRADMARKLDNNIVIDEFTSVVNRETAKSLSVAFSKYIKKNNIKNVVLATCHSDILDWLEPDWVYNTDTKEISRGSHRQPEIVLEILPCSYEAWTLFSQHHYLSGDINISSRCWIATWMGSPIGFVSALPQPSGTIKNGWRGHRTVVLPDFQGMGIGVRISEAVGEILLANGCRYFSKTIHPKMGQYRENSDKWRPTSKNGKLLTGAGHKNFNWIHRKIPSYCHEYMGIQKIL
jgi:ABC-type lipoprotein export system ATPase subunit